MSGAAGARARRRRRHDRARASNLSDAHAAGQGGVQSSVQLALHAGAFATSAAVLDAVLDAADEAVACPSVDANAKSSGSHDQPYGPTKHTPLPTPLLAVVIWPAARASSASAAHSSRMPRPRGTACVSSSSGECSGSAGC